MRAVTSVNSRLYSGRAASCTRVRRAPPVASGLLASELCSLPAYSTSPMAQSATHHTATSCPMKQPVTERARSIPPAQRDRAKPAIVDNLGERPRPTAGSCMCIQNPNQPGMARNLPLTGESLQQREVQTTGQRFKVGCNTEKAAAEEQAKVPEHRHACVCVHSHIAQRQCICMASLAPHGDPAERSYHGQGAPADGQC